GGERRRDRTNDCGPVAVSPRQTAMPSSPQALPGARTLIPSSGRHSAHASCPVSSGHVSVTRNYKHLFLLNHFNSPETFDSPTPPFAQHLKPVKAVATAPCDLHPTACRRARLIVVAV
ncbi:hypothetical protein GW17_00056788, partial [Ensete ventricosum]